MLQIFIRLIKQGIGNLSLFEKLSRKIFEIAFGNIFHNDALRHNRIKIYVVGNRLIVKLVIDIVVNYPFDSVKAAARNIEIASAETDVYLKEFVFSVSLVIFYIKIRKADITDMLKELCSRRNNIGIYLIDNRYGISDSRRGVILKQGSAESRKTNL